MGDIQSSYLNEYYRIMDEGCVASLIDKEGLEKTFWLPKFEELGIKNTAALQHAKGDIQTYNNLKKHIKNDWEGQALQKLLHIDLEKEKQYFGQRSEKAQQILQELHKLCSESKDRNDEKVKKLETDIYNELQVSSDSWISSDKSLDEFIAKVEGLRQGSGLLQARESLDDSSLLQRISGGRALQGILLTKDVKDQLEIRSRVLDVPEHVVMAGASKATEFIQHFTSTDQKDEYEKKLSILGYSVAASAQVPVYGTIPIGAGISHSRRNTDEDIHQQSIRRIYFSTVKYSVVDVASYSFDESDLRICEDARKELKKIVILYQYGTSTSNLWSACKVFFHKYGSHISIGPLCFGGRFHLACSSTGFSSNELESVRKMQNDAVSITAGLTVGKLGVSTIMDFEKIKGAYKGKCKEDTLANTQLSLSINGGPPEASDLETWKTGLVANNRTWTLTDKGHKLVAIWDIIRSNYYEEEFKEIEDELRKAWEDMTDLKAEQSIQLTLAYDSEKVLNEVKEWNKKSLTSCQIKDNVEFLLQVRRDIFGKTANPMIWIKEYLCQPPVQEFIKTVMSISLDSEHIKFLVQQIFEKNDLNQMTTRTFPNIEQVSNWLYGSTQQVKTSMVQTNCSDFNSFDKFLNEIIRENEIHMLHANKSLLEKSAASTLEEVTTDVSVALHHLRSQYKQKYEYVLITILVHPLQSGNYDDVITLKPMTLNDLKDLHSQFLNKKKEFDIFDEKKHPLQLQAFLLSVAVNIYNKKEDVVPLLQYIKQMLNDFSLPLTEELLQELNAFFTCSSSMTDFRQALNSFMSSSYIVIPQHNSVTNNEHSLKALLRTTAIEHKEPLHNYQSDIFQNNPAAYNILQELGLCDYYFSKLKLQDALCIGQDYLKLSLQECSLRDLTHLPKLVLHKLMSHDYLCRSDLIPQDDSSSDISDDIMDECSEDESSDDKSSDYKSFESTSSDDKSPQVKSVSNDFLDKRDDRFTKIHPVDVLLALIHCSDDFLRQDLFSRLAKCQLAVPFFLPDPFTQQPSIPLWAMSSIVKDWKCIKNPKSGSKVTEIEYTEPIIEYGMPIVAFIRIGKHQKRGASKSKLLNEVISDSHYDHFFHRDCRGGQTDPIFGEGMVDMCWYLPAGKLTDVFPDAITFLNLHGDARNYPCQLTFLSQMCSMCFLLVTEDDLILDDKTVDNLKKLSVLSGGMTILNDAEQKFKCKDIKLHSINLATKATDDIKVAIRKRIKRKIQFEASFKTIQACTAEVISQNNISTEESNELYKEGCQLAEEIIALVTTFSDKSKYIKEEMLPLQGETWLAWTKKHKEFYHQIHRGKQVVNEYTANIREEKKIIRQQQLEHVNELTPVMRLFIRTILRLSGQSNIKIRNYFLQCLKLGLDKISRAKITGLQHRYKAIRKILAKIQTKASSSCNQGSVNHESKGSAVSASRTQDKEQISAQQVKQHKDDLELLQNEIINSSFGLEHLFRELGQVYEAAKESFEYGEELSCLPRAVAELLAEGYPLELMDGDAAHVPMQWVSAVLNEVVNILNDPKVYVLSVLGLQSSGKSTLLNTSFGLQFNVSAGRCTRGAFMQLLPLDEELKQQTECSFVMVVDTEGLRAPEFDSLQTQEHDNKLATFVIGLANLTLININGEVQGDMDDILQTSVHAFLRMNQVKYSPSCHFVHHNAGDSLNNQVGREKFTQKLNKFTADAAREEGCEGLYKTFNDVIEFNDDRDFYHFPGLWKGDPPMAPVNSGYSNGAQLLKFHLTELLMEKTNKQAPNFIHERVGDLKLSSFRVKIFDLWEALLKENFVFSFKNTLEVIAYNSLEVEYGMLEWKFHEKIAEWELEVENEIDAANPDKVPNIVKRRCQELYKITSDMYEQLKTEMEQFIKRSEIVVQWKAKFEIKLKNRSEELHDQATNYCKKLGRSKEAIVKFESKRKQYTNMITDKVKDVIVKIKNEQKKLNDSLERGHLDECQLKELSKQDLFTFDKLSKYTSQGILKFDKWHKIIEIQKKFRNEHAQLQHILLAGTLSPEEVKAILKLGPLSEDELKEEFDNLWIKLVNSIPWVEDRSIDVAAAVERQLITFKGNLEGQVIGKLQENAQSECDLALSVVEKKHYKKIKGSSWIGKTVDWFSKKMSFRINDCHQMEAQLITDGIMEEASKYLEETRKKDTDFKETFVLKLLHLLDQKITEKSAKVEEHLNFLPQYRIDVYLTVCRHAVGIFKKMAQCFKEKHDPRLYLERHTKGPLFARFKSQYYQTEAEQAIANNICAYLHEPIRVQLHKLIGRKVVGQMKGSEHHFNSKMALKVKILKDLYKENDFENYMLYVNNVRKGFEKWIQQYTVEHCNHVVSGKDSRLQALSKEEVSQLIEIIEGKVTEINEVSVHGWLSKFCECSELQLKLGISLKVENLLIDDEINIQELNLENFKHQVRAGLQDLKHMLHASLDGIQCETEMEKWKDKPYELLKSIIGCTAQCPFCHEQCDLLDPKHDVKTKKHAACIHRPSCLAGWRNRKTEVMSLSFCPASVAGNGTFYIGSKSDENYPFREYQKKFPDWSIIPDPTSECSIYWMSFVSRFNNAIADKIAAKPASVPSEWAKIQWKEIEDNLIHQYNL